MNHESILSSANPAHFSQCDRFILWIESESSSSHLNFQWNHPTNAQNEPELFHLGWNSSYRIPDWKIASWVHFSGVTVAIDYNNRYSPQCHRGSVAIVSRIRSTYLSVWPNLSTHHDQSASSWPPIDRQSSFSIIISTATAAQEFVSHSRRDLWPPPPPWTPSLFETMMNIFGLTSLSTRSRPSWKHRFWHIRLKKYTHTRRTGIYNIVEKYPAYRYIVGTFRVWVASVKSNN